LLQIKLTKVPGSYKVGAGRGNISMSANAKVVANIKYANLIAVRSALVEEDGGGISVDAMLGGSG
jgi:hypothetical protein